MLLQKLRKKKRRKKKRKKKSEKTTHSVFTPKITGSGS